MHEQTLSYQRYVLKRTEQAVQYLGSRCRVCGTSDPLEFDHVDPATKIVEISTAIQVWHWSWDRLVIELDKCQLLCIVHHKEKTRENKEHRGGQNKIINPVHGTAKMYGDKCRCESCRNWKKLYRRKLVDSLGNLTGMDA